MNYSLPDYAVSFLVIVPGLLAVWLIQALVLARMRKQSKAAASPWSTLPASLLKKSIVPVLYLLIIYFGSRDLAAPPAVHAGVRAVVAVLLAALGIRFALTVLRHGIKSYWLSRPGERSALQEKNIDGIIALVQIVAWALGIVLVLDNLGVKVTAFMTGLGITGIALALAAQTILATLG